MQQTTHTNDFVNAKSHAREKPLLTGQFFELGHLGITPICNTKRLPRENDQRMARTNSPFNPY